MFSKKKKRVEISAPSNFEHRVHTGFDEREQKFTGLPRQWQSLIEESAKRPKPLVDPACITTIKCAQQKTIVRGNKLTPDGSLAWLLDEFESMSVCRSNSLRGESPPCHPRENRHPHQNGVIDVRARQQRGDMSSGPDKKRTEHHGRDRLKEEHRAVPQQPRGQEPSIKHRPPPPDYPKDIYDKKATRSHERIDGRREYPGADRGYSEPVERVVKREKGEEKRPKSTYVISEGSPESPRDKRPLSGPNIRTSNNSTREGLEKTTQTGRPFNTYPRADTDPSRGVSHQVSDSQSSVPLDSKSTTSKGSSRPQHGNLNLNFQKSLTHLFSPHSSEPQLSRPVQTQNPSQPRSPQGTTESVT
ncbi:hypothetical protein GDO86_015817 [Hymenochirus boettgeri]|uniref:non-specific serine/threonine protein kinase n=1 Tax=Hymenochirus boettgeri TaxID=247094 RepID=A0A8T2K0E4_9PIPI|nr:hypothetical protein GDO86_015817 [Hymenochirus boettgeri]